MKTSSKIAIAVAAVGAYLIAKKKGAISGVGRVGYAPTTTAYLVRYIPKYGQFSVDFPMVWLNYENGSANLQNSRDHATRFYSYEEAEATAQQLFDEIYHYENKGFEIVEIHDHDEERVKRAIDELLRHDDRFRYSMLDRMRSDCEYYLGNGNRHGQYLWMSMDPQGHIDVMRALWNSFADDQKPEWLTMEQINDYADRMGVGRIEHSDYDGARIVTKDGLHAISFDIYGRGENGISVTAEMKGDGSRYGFQWEFLSHIGDYKTLSGAIRAAEKYAVMHGWNFNNTDFKNI